MTGVRRTISAAREAFAVDGAEAAAGLGGDDDAGGDVVGLLAEEGAGLEPVGGDEDLLAAGAAQVAEPAGERAGVDGAQGVGADADIVLVVERVGVAGGEAVAVEPGAAPLDAPSTARPAAGWRSRPGPAPRGRSGRC